MIENRWSDEEAERRLSGAGDNTADQELALRVYTSRIIGQNPDLVMHGGGNTSVKVRRPDLFGEVEDVLHVKGSGWDLDTIEAAGLPGVRLQPLLKLRDLDALSDEDMVNVQRCNLLDSASPNPSVETLLHAFLPHKYVDHTHATPFLVLANLPNAEEVAREIFGDRIGIVPYIMPGFGLAKVAADIYDQNPSVEGLLLLNHGHFAYGPTARESYEKIVQHTNEVADYFAMKHPTSLRVRNDADDLSVLPVLRGVIAEQRGNPDVAMPIFDLRNNEDVLAFFNRSDVADLARRGMASPDHVLRTKGWPLVLPKSVWTKGRDAITQAVRTFEEEYRAYFDRQAPNASVPKTLLTPDPRHAWIEGVGVIGIGANAGAARIAADLTEQNMRVRALGEDAGGFHPLDEADQFDCEYWSLEQAKLGKGKPPRFSGRVVMVTGGAGVIGLATAKAFAALGAQCVLVDLHQERIDEALTILGAGHAGFAGDVTAEGTAEAAMKAAIHAFGGLDILVSNAGTATPGAMLDMSDEALRNAFELNFFAHQKFAKAAATLFKAQGRSGQILFNISKQAVNPGKNFGAYGLPKATTLFLMRQLALELGGDGIRVNGVNADRIRSGLLTDDFISERASARGVDEGDYMAGNLLRREVEAGHVADAFVGLALSERTTAHVFTVDGGNIEAALR